LKELFLAGEPNKINGLEWAMDAAQNEYAMANGAQGTESLHKMLIHKNIQPKFIYYGNLGNKRNM
jgi:hypothetical protein